MTDQERTKQAIEVLQTQLTGDMFEDMSLKQQIHELEMKLNGVEPSCDLGEGCENCGS